MSTELQLVQTAIAEFDKVGAGLTELKKQYGGVVYPVTTTKGMGEALSARAAIRAPRYQIEKLRKEAKAPILELGRKLDSEAKRIEAELLAIEGPIDEQIKNEEARKEAEKQAKIDAENKRIGKIQTAIDEIRALPLEASGKTASHAQGVLNRAREIEITEAEYQEFFDTAREALFIAITACQGVVSERVAFEAEQERIRKERAELEQLRAANAARDAQERLRLAEEAKKQREAQQAEADRLAAENAKAEAALQAQRDELARKEREAAAARLAEDLRVQALQDAEAARLAAERAELERQQEEFRKSQEKPKPVPKAERPTDADIIAVLADHYAVTPDTVIGWLSDLKLSVAA